MKNGAGDFTTIGAITRDEINDFRCFLRDGIMAEVVNNSDGEIDGAPGVSALIAVDVNDYSPVDGEAWDVDQWEARQGFIYAPATRNNWALCYRVARVLAAGGSVMVQETGTILKLPGIITVSPN